MTALRPGLGRGLGALLPGPPHGTTADDPADSTPTTVRSGRNGVATSAATAAEPSPGFFAELPVSAISANPRQPRQHFDPDELAELVHSIGEVGLLQPIVVRPTGGDRYELVMGERRWRAARAAGLQRIPAIVRDTADEDMLRDALLENLHRYDLNPLEEAAAYEQLLDDFGCTHEQLSNRLGRSRPHISNTLRLLRLPASVQRRVAAGVLSAGHARALVGAADEATAERLAQRVVAEGLTVRALEELIAVGDPTRQRPRRSRSRSPLPAELAEVADRLSERLDTRVHIELGRAKGKLVVEFASPEDLGRIADLVGAGQHAD
jgi:ParB family transcriptional regulator, chromosome partitioning protein